MNRLEYLETLVQYVQHLKGCKIDKRIKPHCTCGLSEKIAQKQQQDVPVAGTNVTLAQGYQTPNYLRETWSAEINRRFRSG